MTKFCNKILLLFCLLIITLPALAQVKAKIELLPDNTTYRLSIRPEVSYPAPTNVTNNAQFSFLVPSGGFAVGSVTSINGLWSNSNTVLSPSENPEFDYLVFNLVSGTTDITYVNGQEVALFEFTNAGACTGELRLTETDDPFSPPNSQSVNIGNLLTVLGAGLGFNPYDGSYDEPGNCEGTDSGCGITVTNVGFVSPSTCGTADGSISITATGSNGIPLQYSIDGADTWQAGNTFDNLAAGDFFEIHVRDMAAICTFEYGEVDLAAPLAAVVTLYETGKPDCNGGTNGFINVEAGNENNDPLEYSLDGTDWQSTGSFTGLAEGTYFPVIRNLNNNCLAELGPEDLTEDCSTSCPDNDNDGLCADADCDDNNPDLPATPGTPCDDGNAATLNDVIQADGCGCAGQEDTGTPLCVADLDIVLTDDGRYEVGLTSNVSYSFPNNITSTAQFTVRAPSGVFEPGDFVNALPGVIFEQNSTTLSPPEAPEYDYFSFGLITPGTQGIPYQAGERTALFSFVNAADCDDLPLALTDNATDPFFPPNSLNINSGQQITVSGWGSEAPLCLAANSSVNCPDNSPQDPLCIVSYGIDKLPDGTFRVSLTPSVTYSAPDNITSTAQITVKVPTASGGNDGFSVTEFTNLVPNVLFGEASRQNAPPEDPEHDYISFALQTLGTSGITYEAGVAVPLFSFRNGGSCEDRAVFLMNNLDDPFLPPNSADANIGQQITIAGWGAGGTPVCTTATNIDDCNVFTPETEIITVNIDPDAPNEVCFTEVVDVPNGVGTVSLCNAPASTEILLTEGSSCMQVTALGDFSAAEEICVVVCDAVQTEICDTTFVYLCPALTANAASDLVCPGETTTLNISGGTGNYVWSPAAGLSCTDCANPTASPSETTTYTVTSTSTFCTSSATITVETELTDFVEEVNTTGANCGSDNGQIALTLSAEDAPYSMTLALETTVLAEDIPNSETSYAFENLAQGDYNLYVTDNTGCIDTLGVTVAEIEADFGITAMLEETTCSTQTGSVELSNTPADAAYTWTDADGGDYPDAAILEDLAAGFYTVVVTTPDGCAQTLEYQVIASDAAEIVDLIFTEVICFGETNGTVSFGVNGTGDYTYEISAEDIEPILNIAEAGIPAFENGLAAGEYLLTVSDPTSGCPSFAEFIITENAEMTAALTAIAATDCDAPDGMICAEVTGGTAPYTLTANAGTIEGLCIINLLDETVTLTLTDAAGCTLTRTENAEIDCDEDCDLIAQESISVSALNGNATVCLPTEGLDLEEFTFTFGGETFEPTVGECPDRFVLLMYGFISENNAPPFRLTAWNYGSGTLTDREFDTFAELIEIMNEVLPSGNWELDETTNTIRGIDADENIGSLFIEHIGSGSDFELPLAGANVAYQSIDLFVENDGMLLVNDPLNDCTDSVFLSVENEQIDSRVDTVYLTAFLNTTLTDICIDTTNLPGTLDAFTVCAAAENGMIEVNTMSCLNYQPGLDYLGDDEFCIILCDENGICQTTIFVVEVITRDLIIYNGFSPNGDGVNDFFFIRNIDLFPNNRLSIYNRWGNRVYSAEGYENTYDGTFDGHTLPDGTYFYTLEVNENRYRGFLEILR